MVDQVIIDKLSHYLKREDREIFILSIYILHGNAFDIRAAKMTVRCKRRLRILGGKTFSEKCRSIIVDLFKNEDFLKNFGLQTRKNRTQVNVRNIHQAYFDAKL